MLSFIETLCVLNPSRVVGDELVVRNIAELIYGLDILFPLLYTEQLYTLCRKITIFFFLRVDPFKPGPLSGLVGLVVHQNRLLVFLQRLDSLQLLLRIVNWGQVKDVQELVLSKVEELAERNTTAKEAKIFLLCHISMMAVLSIRKL